MLKLLSPRQLMNFAKTLSGGNITVHNKMYVNSGEEKQHQFPCTCIFEKGGVGDQPLWL